MRTQNFPTSLTSLLAAVGVTVATLSALGQAPVISSLSQDGQLVCTNLLPGSTASVEWASSPVGPWTNNWAGLDAVTVDSNGVIQVSVPMFYRVRGFGRETNATTPPTNMAIIPAGSFTMGDQLGDWPPEWGQNAEIPAHTNYVSSFYMDKYEVTFAVWNDVHQWATNHGYGFEYGAQGKTNNHPVHSVTWYDAVKWCNARSEKEGRVPSYHTNAAQTEVYRSGRIEVRNEWVNWSHGYRLPTEAEWERAARGGAIGHRFPWSNVDTITHGQANYFSDATYPYDVNGTDGYHPAFGLGSPPYTSPVGYFEPNEYGLYDMAGNVLEWCWDCYEIYSGIAETDPRGPATGSFRISRGGGWGSAAFSCRAASRVSNVPGVAVSWFGFRTVLPSE